MRVYLKNLNSIKYNISTYYKVKEIVRIEMRQFNAPIMGLIFLDFNNK